MSIDSINIVVGGLDIEVVRKEIKNLHVGVYPPHGRVRVAAPYAMGTDAVRLAVVSRLGWIRRQRAGFQKQDRESRREMVSGESHYYNGRRYLLDVVDHEGRPTVKIIGNRKLELRVRPSADRDQRERILRDWYRRQLRRQLPQLVAKWEPKVGEAIADVRLRRMKTRWGSCNADARRITLNLELAKKPATCVEYVLVHEMVHLLERHHTDRFRELMDNIMPSWRLSRDELNRAPLAYEDWKY